MVSPIRKYNVPFNIFSPAACIWELYGTSHWSIDTNQTGGLERRNLTLYSWTTSIPVLCYWPTLTYFDPKLSGISKSQVDSIRQTDHPNSVGTDLMMILQQLEGWLFKQNNGIFWENNMVIKLRQEINRKKQKYKETHRNQRMNRQGRRETKYIQRRKGLLGTGETKGEDNRSKTIKEVSKSRKDTQGKS